MTDDAPRQQWQNVGTCARGERPAVHAEAAGRDRQSGTARPTHHRVLADACRVRRDPAASPLAKAEFATIRERLIKIGARVIAHTRIRIQLPTSCSERALFRTVALG